MTSYTTATTFLEHASSNLFTTYHIPTNSPASLDEEPEPLLNQPDHALSSTTFQPLNSNGSTILCRIIEDGYTLELRWLNFIRENPSSGSRNNVGVAGGKYKELNQQGTLPPIRFVFPSRLVPTPFTTIVNSNESNESVLQLYALTESGYLYVLNFSNNLLFYSPTLSLEETRYSQEYKVDYLEGRVPVLMHGVAAGRVIVGCSDGFNCSLELPENGDVATLHETELKSSSSFSVRSLVSSFSTRSLASTSATNFSSPSQLLSIASLPSEDLTSFAFGITRDRKLKIWNLDSGTCLKAIDLPRSFSTAGSNNSEVDFSRGTYSPSNEKSSTRNKAPLLLPPTPQSLVKLISGPEDSPYLYYLLLFVPSSPGYDSAFSVFGITLDNSGAVSEITPVTEKLCRHSASSMVDFNIASFGPEGNPTRHGEVVENWTLWSIWEEAGESEIRYISLPELVDGDVVTSEEDLEWTTIERGSAALSLWNAGHFDEILKDNPKSVQEVFVQHIFYPARYPPATLEYALGTYEDNLSEEFDPRYVPEALSIEYNTTFDRICAVVGCSIELETSPQTGAVLYDLYNKRLKGEWLKFVAICNESRSAALFPTCLTICSECQGIMVIMRDAISVPIVQDTVSAINSLLLSEDNTLILNYLDLPPSVLEVSYPHLAPMNIRHDILAIFKTISTLKAGLTSSASKQIDVEIGLKLEAVVKTRTPFNVNIDDIAGDFYDRAMEPCISDDLQESLSNSLRQLHTPAESFHALWNLLTTPELTRSTKSSSSSSRPSDLSSALLSDALSSTIETRYTLARDLFVLLCYIKAEEDGFILEISSITGASFATLHTYSSLQWIIQQSSVPLSTPSSSSASMSNEAILERFGEMKVSNSIDDSATPSFSLLSGLIRDKYSPSLLSTSSLPQALMTASSQFLKSLGLLSPKLLVVDSREDVSFALRLYEIGLPDLALEFVGKYPQAAGMLYVKGLSLLELGRPEEAQIDLARAAAALFVDSIRIDEGAGISHVLPSEIAGSLARYYRYLVTLFVARDVHLSIAHFASLAIESFADEGIEEESVLKDLWLQLFRSNAALELYEEAYNNMMATPYRDTKNTSLAHLVSVLCENGRFDLLIRFSFVGLRSELERDLSFRARNSDPLASPNYYQILYAYHIAKGDYRSAGSIMFQQSRRIGEMSGRGGSFKDVATLQCQSYLAAINALSLVESAHAWVAVYLEEDGEKSSKRRKIHYHIPEVEYESTTRAAEVMELSDIRKEYTVALSRLQLCADFPELERTNFTLDSDAIVALFSQIGSYDSAFTSARTLEVDMSSLFESLTEKCVGLASHGALSEDASWVALNDEAATWEGVLASKAWKLLQRHLDRHDDETLKYRLVVLSRTLALDVDGKVPSWLIDSFLARDSPMLIRTMIKFDRLNDAFRYSLAVIKTAATPTSPASVWLPYSLFDQLLSLSGRDSQALSVEDLQSQQAQLRLAVDQQMEIASKAQRTAFRIAR